MKKYYLLLIILLLITVPGCKATMHYLNDGVQNYSATVPANVKIYSGRQIDKDIVEIGHVSVHITNAEKGDALKEAIREEAASIGADAVVDFKIVGQMAGGVAVKFK